MDNPNTEDTVQYSNKYGSVTLILDKDVRLVRDVHGEDIPEDYLLSLGVAEEVVLITENHKIQVGFLKDWRTYILYHTAPDKVRLAKVTYQFTSDRNPAEELERLNRVNPPVW